MGPHRCAQPSARAPQPCGLSKEKRDVERGRVPGKGVEKPSPATPVLKYWKKPHAGEMPVVLPGHLHPTAGRRTQLWWTQPASTPKNSFPESLVIPSVRGGERAKRNRGTDNNIIPASALYQSKASPFQRNELRCLFCETTTFRVQTERCRVLIASFYSVQH